jgi:hypothetical protein
VPFAELRSFAAKKFQTVENERESPVRFSRCMLCGVWNRHERTKCKRLPLFSRCITARREPLEEPKKSKKASLLNLETL